MDEIVAIEIVRGKMCMATTTSEAKVSRTDHAKCLEDNL